MRDPDAFDLHDRAFKEFEDLVGLAKTIAPLLPLPAQKALSILHQEHKNRSKNLYVPSPGGPPVAAAFTLGPPQPPNINFDHGFLDRVVHGLHTVDDGKREAPTSKDYKQYRRWDAAGLGAFLVRPDLADACLAYLHFLHGGGADFRFAYERFVTTDECGRRVLASASEDTKMGAIALGRALATIDDPRWKRNFDMRSRAVPVADGDRYPYPSTENWQKAIGAHALWISAKVDMALDPPRDVARFDVAMTMHGVDMYNFNPDNHDIATGIADAENGRLEITGLAHEFLQTGEVARTLAFEVPLTIGHRRLLEAP